jgi:hypothetical protein
MSIKELRESAEKVLQESLKTEAPGRGPKGRDSHDYEEVVDQFRDAIVRVANEVARDYGQGSFSKQSLPHLTELCEFIATKCVQGS